MKISVHGALGNSGFSLTWSQYVMTCSARAPTIVPRVSRVPASKIFSGAMPSRCPGRLAVHSPVRNATAIITPYQRTGQLPTWNAIGSTVQDLEFTAENEEQNAPG